MKQTFEKQVKALCREKGKRKPLSVLVVGAECAPYAKTGGLADVVGTLPQSLKTMGIDARIIIPCHRVIKEKYGDQMEHLCHFDLYLGWRSQYIGIEKLMLGDIPVYLVDNEYYFGNDIYMGGDFECEQYAYFCRAVLAAIEKIDFVPDILHVNDWHTAAIPMLLRTQYNGTALEKIRTVFTIHNIAYQGKNGIDRMCDLLALDWKYATWEYMQYDGCANLMKSAFVFSDKINTVSPTYAREILTDEYGEGLQHVLRTYSYKLSGIVNGIDTEVFDPKTDKLIEANYDSNDLSGKALCKKAMCEELGFDETKPLLGMVTRMTSQKGFDIIMNALEQMMALDVNFVLLGSGDRYYEDYMRYIEAKYPKRIKAHLAYNEALSHKIYAASDFFLMPSQFEPCGISQMLAMRYGSLPIVRQTGGLRDTVAPYNRHTGQGTGFGFVQYNSYDLLDCIKKALEVYDHALIMEHLMKSGMDADFSFTLSAFEYAKLYISTL